MDPIETPPNIPQALVVGQSPLKSRGAAIWGIPGALEGAAVTLMVLREYVPEIRAKLNLSLVFGSMILALLGSAVFIFLVRTKGKPGQLLNRAFFIGALIGAGAAAAICFATLRLQR